ncbi:amidohydrolase [Bacillus badius]|uniref:Exoenzymes regulatory protein AepA n=1 Tax=Bacillus badius TaxID=1455 RepID=A0ABR5AVV7_BACBA|nr:amidohydrolase [Bacillus badius]KIL78876.1 Exoenzymes regulatory protein AepA precursor [Bacillus badius]MED4717397.1 amidohydrolase [Bacillus badius]
MKADVVFVNGEVITVDKHDSIQQALAVKANKILAVGSNAALQAFVGEGTRVVDLKGKSLLPGIVDAHLHLVLYGVFQLNLSCKDPKMPSIDALLAKLKERASKTPKGQWVRAWGFNERTINEKRYPTLQELDAVSTDHPIVITRTCGHIGVANSRALHLASINEQTITPQGGIIEKGTDGKLTGRLIETAYMRMNETARYTPAELQQAISIAQQHFIQTGITSIHEAGTFDQESYRLLQLTSNTGDLKIRVYAMIGALNDCKQFTLNMINAGVVTGTGNEFFKIGPAKLFTDGSSTGPTIATREGYTSNKEDRGILYYSEDEIYEVLGEAHKRGYQITVHAQGDQAIDMYLNVVEKALQEAPRNNHRHRIEHAGISSPDLQERMKKLGVIPVPNPPFPYEFGESYLHNYGARTDFMYPARDFIDRGILAAAGSDAPITTYNPWVGIHTAVNRRINTGSPFGNSQKISLLEAIRMYTYNGAYASFEETIKGSLEAGKLADLVVLDRSILNESPEKLKDIKVEWTMIDGELVFERTKTGAH